MKKILSAFFAVCCFSSIASAQIPTATTLVAIVKAEDERRYDATLENLLKNPNEKIRVRAALAAGRIGDERAVLPLINLLEKDLSVEVRTMAAFALGEIESLQGADAIIKILADTKNDGAFRARSTEAAGKIAAANAKDEKSKALGEAITDALDYEDKRRSKPNTEAILSGLTAVLRARPVEGEIVAAKFLTYMNARIRADAANTLSRLRAKNANEPLRAMLLSDEDGVARANAARALGASEDKAAFEPLLKAALTDQDSRVRVSAIRSLGSLKDVQAADKLLERGNTLLTDYKKSKSVNPSEKSELLEIATTLGGVLPNSSDERAVKFLQMFREADSYRSPEPEIALARLAPQIYVNSTNFDVPKDSGFMMGFFNAAGATYYANTYAQSLGNFAQGLGEIANNKGADEATVKRAKENITILGKAIQAAVIFSNPEAQLLMAGKTAKDFPAEYGQKFEQEIQKFRVLKNNLINAFPDVLRAMAKLKPEKYESEIAEFLLNKSVVIFTAKDGKKYAATTEYTGSEIKESEYYLLNKDVVIRATAAELMGEMKDVNSGSALASAFDFAVNEDKEINDAQLAILDAIVKQSRETSKKVLLKALDSPGFLVRQRAANLIKQNDLTKDFPNAEQRVGMVKTHNPQTKTKLGQILNTDADYLRAVSRKNARAILTTEKGSFTIEFTPADAPLTVDNFIKLAKSGYFNGLAIHRVVPNFVMQDGDPRGDGNGGPGWQIRCEVNLLSYERGAVGMALSGKDTGGSQWFVTHSPQPHLDGGYTVFGRVNETDMKIVDNLVRGDKILTVKIVEGNRVTSKTIKRKKPKAKR
jgi:cyclophilin family peptidyl-prolyl cis-trans isomerase/HEAT repeat protein